MEGFLDIAATAGVPLMKSTHCQVLQERDMLDRPSKDLFAEPWRRADGSKVRIDTA
jgi:hypothetical protein